MMRRGRYDLRFLHLQMFRFLQHLMIEKCCQSILTCGLAAGTTGQKLHCSRSLKEKAFFVGWLTILIQLLVSFKGMVAVSPRCSFSSSFNVFSLGYFCPPRQGRSLREKHSGKSLDSSQALGCSDSATNLMGVGGGVSHASRPDFPHFKPGVL